MLDSDFSYDAAQAWAHDHDYDEMYKRQYNQFVEILTDEEGDFDPQGYFALQEMRKEFESKGGDFQAGLIESQKSRKRNKEIISLLEAEGAFDKNGVRYEKSDLGELRNKLQAAKERHVFLKARNAALQCVLNSWHVGGILRSYGNLPGPGTTEYNFGEMKPRAFDYFETVHDLIGKSFKNPTRYFQAIAQKTPKRDGTGKPTEQAVWDWFKSNDYVENGQELNDFRPGLESIAQNLKEFGIIDSSQT